MSNITKYSFENVKVVWTKLQENNPEPPYQGEGVNNWTIQAVLSDEQADAYKKTGLFPKIKRDIEHELVLHDGLRQVKLKKSTTFGEGGQPKKPVIVVDTYGNPFTDLIGNESICNIQCSGHNWSRDGKENTSLELQAVQILELVEYREDQGTGEEFVPTFDFQKQEKVALADVAGDNEEDIPF
ncbi:MAG: hypothetical protein ABGY11_10175 [Candidatus Thioglobus sp.]|jgi:hypothetical protein